MALPDNPTVEQILDYYPHPIPQPDSEEARQRRVGQRFRMHFLLDVVGELDDLGNKPASPEREEKARALRIQLEAVQALMLQPKYEFLVENHARQIQNLLDEARELIG